MGVVNAGSASSDGPVGSWHCRGQRPAPPRAPLWPCRAAAPRRGHGRQVGPVAAIRPPLPPARQEDTMRQRADMAGSRVPTSPCLPLPRPGPTAPRRRTLPPDSLAVVCARKLPPRSGPRPSYFAPPPLNEFVAGRRCDPNGPAGWAGGAGGRRVHYRDGRSPAPGGGASASQAHALRTNLRPIKKKSRALTPARYFPQTAKVATGQGRTFDGKSSLKARTFNFF